MYLKTDFVTRVEEIEIFFSFAKEINSIETYRQKKLQINNEVELTVKRDLQKIIRSNCYLILYNCIEATIRNGIWNLLDAIHDEKLCYQDLSKEIQNIWLKEQAQEIGEISNQKRLRENIKEIIDFRLQGHIVVFSKSRISLSGNLDFKSIETLLREFGIHGKINTKDKLKLGKALLKVKSERNALAHGNKSFRQSAEVITIQELIEYKDLIISYLEDITNNFIIYIEKKKFSNKIPHLQGNK
jgi:hypothetical protein